MKLEILYQDDNVAVISKPSGISMFSDRSSEENLWDLLKKEFGNKKIYQVHRIDKGTSGILLVALSESAQSDLTKQFNDRTVNKTYIAICVGELYPPSGTIDLPLSPGRKRRFRVAGLREHIYLDNNDVPTWRVRPSESYESSKRSFPSVTKYRKILSNKSYSLIAVRPITGRTHQIRVHFSWLGYPLVGDNLYGKPDSDKQKAERLALHSFQIEFEERWKHSQPFERVKFQDQLPSFFTDFLLKNEMIKDFELVDLSKRINETVDQLA